MKQKAFSPIIIRKEIQEDISVIREVNLKAFKGPGEAQVVDLLREKCDPFVSIVAELRGQIVGHILFTPVRLVTDNGEVLEGMGLAPLSVHPDFQNQGIGRILCEAGLDEMQAQEVPFVVVLGHPNYYPRFGFEPASDHKLRCAYEGVPPEAFMIKIFQPQILEGLSGVIHYRAEFDEVT
ncbi:MAG: N-acetyltransferase [Anaerolineaceae bacterium]|nr:N-acetyltransferase [Anaerolineaceae bacterium]